MSSFLLDKYEVTVARFRAFVNSYQGPPATNAGANPWILDSGWKPAWDTMLPTDQVDFTSRLLACPVSDFSSSSGANDQKPANCMDWYQAFAFCAWDNAFLPTELEWQYAAAGGTENRLYPWIGTAFNTSLALYGYCDNGISTDCQVTDIADVGSRPAGAGKYGQLDLMGSMWEWLLDSPTDTFPPAAPCDDCAALTGTANREIRGGSWFEAGPSNYFGAAARLYDPPHTVWKNVGLRCARAP